MNKKKPMVTYFTGCYSPLSNRVNPAAGQYRDLAHGTRGLEAAAKPKETSKEASKMTVYKKVISKKKPGSAPGSGGRPPLPPEKKKKKVVIYVVSATAEKIKKAGGGPFFARLIERELEGM